MMRAASALARRWRSLGQGAVVDAAAEVGHLTLDVLEQTIFSDGLGRDPDEMRRAMNVYFEMIGRIDPFDVIGLPRFVPRFTRFSGRSACRFFDATVDETIARRRRRLAEDPVRVPRDLLTLLLQAEDPESGKGMSEDEVKANVLTFIAAGQETTANALTWSLFLLSQAPDWRERVAHEAKRETSGPVEGRCERLIVTRAVIDEAMRLYPPIAAISRVALGPDELAGQRIERGTIIVIAPYVLHRHRALWPQPDMFDPNRFLGDARATIGRFAYLPFGAGPRICIGSTFALQEATLALAILMRDFSLDIAPGHVVWPVQRVTLRPRNGLPMVIRRSGA
jgi:cytochrome P450